MSFNRTHWKKNVLNWAKNRLGHHSSLRHIHAPSRLFVSSAIITMRQAAWQRCGTKRRSGGDSKARTRRAETQLKLPRVEWRDFVLHLYIFAFEANENTTPQTGNNRQTPSSLQAQATSMAALPTITPGRSERKIGNPPRHVQQI